MTSKRLRILQVSASIAPVDGGPATGMLAINARLNGLGHDACIYTTSAGWAGSLVSSAGASFTHEGARIVMYPQHFPRKLKTSYPLNHSLAGAIANADVVHIHGLYFHPGSAAARAARRSSVPYVIQPHGTLEPYQRKTSVLRKATFDLLWGAEDLRHASAFVLASDSEKLHAVDIVGDRGRVIPLGADVGPGTSAPTWWKPDFEGKRLVIFVGRISAKKRLDLLIAAWQKVHHQHPDSCLLIAGPDDKHILARLLADMPKVARESVHPLGMVLGSDKGELFIRASLFVLPSENENFGVSVAESLSAHVPVIVSKNVALAEEVAAAGAGWVLTQNDEVTLSATLEAALGCNDLSLAVKRSRAAALGQQFSWDRTAAGLAALYKSLADSGPL